MSLPFRSFVCLFDHVDVIPSPLPFPLPRMHRTMQGAYEAGVVKGLVENLPAEGRRNRAEQFTLHDRKKHDRILTYHRLHTFSEVRWDVTSGISAGSLVAASMLTFAKGDERALANFLVNVSTSLTKADIYQQWPMGVVEGLFERTGIFDTAPLRLFLQKNVFSRSIKDRKLVVSACSVKTGDLQSWNETSLDLLDGCMASSAIPGAFPAIVIPGKPLLPSFPCLSSLCMRFN